MPGGSEPSQLVATGPVLGNTANLPDVRTLAAVRRCSSTDSHQTFSHLSVQQRRPSEQPHNSKSPTSQQSKQQQTHDWHAVQGTQARNQPSLTRSQQPGPTAIACIATGQQSTAVDLATQLLQLSKSSITDLVSQYTLEELRQALGHLHHSQLQQLHEQLLQLQGQEAGSLSCTAGQPQLNSKPAQQQAAATPAAAPAARLRSRGSKQATLAAARPPAGRQHAQQQQQQQEAQQQQQGNSVTVAHLAALDAAAGDASADVETEACVAVKPIEQCSAEEVQALHPTSLRARFERLTAEQQGVVLLELEQLEEVEQAHRAKRARREAAAAARVEAAAAVQLRKSARQRKHVDLDGDTDHAAQGNPASMAANPAAAVAAAAAAAATGVVAWIGACQQLQQGPGRCHQAAQQREVATRAVHEDISSSGGIGLCAGSLARVSKRACVQPSSAQQSTPDSEFAVDFV